MKIITRPAKTTVFGICVCIFLCSRVSVRVHLTLTHTRSSRLDAAAAIAAGDTEEKREETTLIDSRGNAAGRSNNFPGEELTERERGRERVFMYVFEWSFSDTLIDRSIAVAL